MPRAKVTVIVPTFNCPTHLRKCLDSVKWADEILICDSYSTDNTLTIAREYTDRIVQHEYINSAKQKNWIIPQAAHEWVLLIDSDEYLDDDLQQELQALLENVPADFDAFKMPRKNLVFGRWCKSCRMYPDFLTRLFKRDAAHYEDKEVHAHITLPGQIGTLKGHFIHHDFEDVSQTVVKWGRYTRYEGDQMEKVGRKFSGLAIATRPFLVFLYFYFWTGGFREGYRGFYLSAMWSYYVFLKHARLWELEWRKSPDGYRYWNHEN